MASLWCTVTERHIFASETYAIIMMIISSDSGLSPDQCQPIIWTNDGLLLIGPLETNSNEICIKMLQFSFKEMHFKNFVREMVAILLNLMR